MSTATTAPHPPTDLATVATSRREHQRKLLQCQARASIAGQGPQIVNVFNIGQGGLGVIASTPVANGTRFQVRMTVPGLPNARSSFLLQASVAYCAPTHNAGRYRIGLRFEGLSAAAEQAIRRFVST